MTRTLTTLAAAATLAVAAIAAPSPAQARGGGAVAAGVIGGLAAGAIIGGARPIPWLRYYGGGYYAAARTMRARLRLAPGAFLGGYRLARPPGSGLLLTKSEPTFRKGWPGFLHCRMPGGVFVVNQISDKLGRPILPGSDLGLNKQLILRSASGRAHPEITMKKTLLAIATSAVLAVATLAPTSADARCRGCGVGLGILGGLAAGASDRRRDRQSGPAYAYPRSLLSGRWLRAIRVWRGSGYGCPGGYWARRPVRDPYGNVVGWSRPRFFCPVS